MQKLVESKISKIYRTENSKTIKVIVLNSNSTIPILILILPPI